MKRERVTPRSDWQQKLEAIGFTFHSLDGVYWTENVCYAFTAEEIDLLESVTAGLQALCLEAVEQVIRRNLFDRLAIPELLRDRIVASWGSDEPSLYGRFDLRFDGVASPTLLEYNADTPTSLVEASIAQWFWLEETRPECDQFNSLHEKLIARWNHLRSDFPNYLHFACTADSAEDYRTVEYLRDTAVQAGFRTAHLFMDDIGWASSERLFLDLEGRPIQALFKLYPWEWLARDSFGAYLASDPMKVMEPCWKMVLSNKGILAVLWELFRDHPNLLPAYFDPKPLGATYVKKPLLSREGANIEVIMPDGGLSSAGAYGQEGYVYQAFAPLPSFDHTNYPMIGSWIVGDEPAGIGIRESDTLITTNTSRFVPHYFVPRTGEQ